MIHLMILLMVLALALGLGSIAVAWQMSMQYRLAFIKYLIVFLIALNVAAVIGIFHNYFDENLKAAFSVGAGRWVDTSYRFLANLLLLVVGGSLVYMLRALVDERPAETYIRVLLGIWAVIVATFVVGIWFTPAGSPVPLTVLANITLDQTVQYVVVFECGRAWMRAASLTDSARRSWTRGLLSVFGSIWVGLIAMSFLMLTNELGSRLFNLLSAVFYVVFNLLPLAFLGRFLRRAFGQPSWVAAGGKRSLTTICDRYGISRRERDIIDLVCKGYPNKKIADELSISLSTVKDHNHNIFRKLGVGNRTELVARLNQASA